mmetsp:Transcript_101056/g.324589  ORF Transcript_101056/g.324589 Transcript_101056/m.324589 type:complete len:241 (-) Transcript_101056:1409-2131(-)
MADGRKASPRVRRVRLLAPGAAPAATAAAAGVRAAARQVSFQKPATPFLAIRHLAGRPRVRRGVVEEALRAELWVRRAALIDLGIHPVGRHMRLRGRPPHGGRIRGEVRASSFRQVRPQQLLERHGVRGGGEARQRGLRGPGRRGLLVVVRLPGRSLPERARRGQGRGLRDALLRRVLQVGSGHLAEVPHDPVKCLHVDRARGPLRVRSPEPDGRLLGGAPGRGRRGAWGLGPSLLRGVP